jgi:hypothetical protein
VPPGEEQEEYDPPGVATIFPLRSKHAGDIKTELAVSIGKVLAQEKLIDRPVSFPGDGAEIVVKFDEMAGKRPVRKHGKHWIDGGSQVVGIHPDTYIPFFINSTGSEVCRLCDGERSVAAIISQLSALRPDIPSSVLIRDLVSFLLLLEELDLVDITG